MKHVWLLIRLLLPIAAIVLLVFSTKNAGDDQNALLCGGLFCSSLGIWLNIWFQRKERKNRE